MMPLLQFQSPLTVQFDPSLLWRVAAAPWPLWFVLGGGLVAISLAVAVTRWHPALRQQAKVQQAVQSWVPVILVAAVSVLLGSGLTWLVCAVTSMALLREGMRLLPLTPGQRRAHGLAAGVLSVLCHVLLAAGLPLWAWGLAWVYVGVLMAPAHMMLAGPAQFLGRVGGLTLVIQACVILFLFVPALVLQAPEGRPFGGQGQGVFFFVLMIFSDAMQYVGGKKWGRRFLAPAVSPSKTWEGLVFAGMVCAALGAVLGPWLLGWPLAASAVLGLAMVLVGLVGDLLVSSWKRDVGVKDTGTLLPGQGGLLDRCDSLLFVAPWFWLTMQVLP